MRKRVYVVWVGLMLLLLGTILYLGLGEKNTNTEFRRMEHTLEEAASIYYEVHNLGIVSGEEIKVNIKTLLDENIVDKIMVDGYECKGSVIISKNNKEFSYKADIKCGSYSSQKN